MALINIIAKSSQIIDWSIICIEIAKLEISDIEIFPIPKEIGFNYDSIGILVHSNYSNRKKVVSELIALAELLFSLNYTLIELYNGELINDMNVRLVVENLLPEFLEEN